MASVHELNNYEELSKEIQEARIELPIMDYMGRSLYYYHGNKSILPSHRKKILSLLKDLDASMKTLDETLVSKFGKEQGKSLFKTLFQNTYFCLDTFPNLILGNKNEKTVLKFSSKEAIKDFLDFVRKDPTNSFKRRDSSLIHFYSWVFLVDTPYTPEEFIKNEVPSTHLAGYYEPKSSNFRIDLNSLLGFTSVIDGQIPGRVLRNQCRSFSEAQKGWILNMSSVMVSMGCLIEGVKFSSVRDYTKFLLGLGPAEAEFTLGENLYYPVVPQIVTNKNFVKKTTKSVNPYKEFTEYPIPELSETLANRRLSERDISLMYEEVRRQGSARSRVQGNTIGISSALSGGSSLNLVTTNNN